MESTEKLPILHCWSPKLSTDLGSIVTIWDIDIGYSFITFSYELKSSKGNTVALLPEDLVADYSEDDETDMPEELAVELSGLPSPIGLSKLGEINEEVDHMAENRHCKHMDTHKEWAAKVLKVLLCHCKAPDRGGWEVLPLCNFDLVFLHSFFRKRNPSKLVIHIESHIVSH